MNSDSTIRKNNEETIEDENFENVVDLKAQISKLSTESEKYRQQLHDLHRKLETTETMFTELLETNEALEQTIKQHKTTIDRRVHEVEEKYIARRKELEEKIEEMEAELDAKSKENGELQEQIKISNEALANLKKVQLSTSIKEDNSAMLESQLEEMSELLEQETEIRKQLEATIESRESQCNEMREMLEASKRQQVEQNEKLESMNEQLMNYRMELESSKVAVETDRSKGNSLFAEVEDRRKMTLEQMNAMKDGYLKAKRSFQAKEAEIRALKLERAMFLRKWEDDTVEKVQDDAHLINKYKARIAELETQLNEEKKKRTETAKSTKLPESQFKFLQSLLEAKKKEVEELRNQIENSSINALLEEEMKHKMGRQLRHWRMRAMTGEAQLLSIKNRLESDPSSSNIEILETIKTLGGSMREDDPNDSSIVQHSRGETTIVDETMITLKDLMTIPKLTISQSSEVFSSEANEKMDKTVPVSDCENTFSMKMTENDFAIGESTTKSTESEPRQEVTILNEPTPDFHKNGSPSTVLVKNEEFGDENISAAPILKSSLVKHSINNATISTNKEANDKNTKTLRFTEDTIDPPVKVLKKQTAATPKYPIIFISSNKLQKN